MTPSESQVKRRILPFRKVSNFSAPRWIDWHIEVYVTSDSPGGLNLLAIHLVKLAPSEKVF
ncbi:MAG: hypothetical protein DRQ24_08390 [Candidatus Latescibacterota bacterium]|nr:MAG: hypothetical protein DRQ24_08390 [Candidatus Latescibacterota bacterium]